jgi:hypothetical protein
MEHLCGELVRRPRTRCPVHYESSGQGPRERLYRSARWRRFRADHLATFPWCVRLDCGQRAVDLNHIQDLADGGDAFDPANVEGLCKHHHGVVTRKTRG